MRSHTLKFIGLTLTAVSVCLGGEAGGQLHGGYSNSPSETSGTIYSPTGKRDPFKAPVLSLYGRDVTSVNPLEKYTVDQFQLRAILKGIGKARAMFEDPDGKTHILTEGQILGRERARVSRILNDEVVLTERTTNYLGVESLYEKVLSLPPEKEMGNVDAAQDSQHEASRWPPGAPAKNGEAGNGPGNMGAPVPPNSAPVASPAGQPDASGGGSPSNDKGLVF